jgi:hypothetical protein
MTCQLEKQQSNEIVKHVQRAIVSILIRPKACLRLALPGRLC